MNDITEVKVGPEGRVLIPLKVRRAVGIQPGEKLVVRVEGDHILLVPRDAVKRRLQEMFEGAGGSMADELIRERRQEAAGDASQS